MRYSQLQTLGSGGLTTQGAPTLAAFPRDIKLPSDTQWNAEVQMMLPWATIARRSAYVGHHSFNTFNGTNINAVDFGVDVPAGEPGHDARGQHDAGRDGAADELLRAIRGYGSITLQWQRGWRTFHSLQLSFQRRFQNGISFGFNDTIGALRSAAGRREAGAQQRTARSRMRDDQAKADELLGKNIPATHIMQANFVWDLPGPPGGHHGSCGPSATCSTTGSSRASGRRPTGAGVHGGLQLPERRRQHRT